MIHKFQQNGDFIVLDVNSGDAGALAELDELVAEGLLFADTPGHEGAVANYTVKSLCLLVSQECNLRCAYCFAHEGAYHQAGRGLMDAATAQAAIDFLISNSGDRHNLEVDFFGGEPLLNFDVVKQTVDYARKIEGAAGKNIRFTITTNGLLLDEEITNYINENMQNVVLSLDGRREINDAHRGAGTYDRLAAGFADFANRREQDNYYIRGTFTARNPDFAADVLHLADLGFRQISIEPVIAQKGDLRLDYSHIPQILENYDILAREILAREKNGNGFNFFHFMMNLENSPCFEKRISGCGAGYEYMAVMTDGRLYPCHQFAGIADFAIGDVFGGISDADIPKKLAGCNVVNNPICAPCWAKYHCSGGCIANAYAENGDINRPDEIGCILMKKRLECAIWLAAARAQQGD